MMTSAVEDTQALASAIDKVEEAYEYMLAYAAQGRRTDDDGTSSPIRDYLKSASEALDLIERTTPAMCGVRSEKEIADIQPFLKVLHQDAAAARAAFRFVSAQHAIGSQIIDNLNASIHVRALLTDLFLLDESLKISGL
jgi:hypothetical protein